MFMFWSHGGRAQVEDSNHAHCCASYHLVQGGQAGCIHACSQSPVPTIVTEPRLLSGQQTPFDLQQKTREDHGTPVNLISDVNVHCTEVFNIGRKFLNLLLEHVNGIRPSRPDFAITLANGELHLLKFTTDAVRVDHSESNSAMFAVLISYRITANHDAGKLPRKLTLPQVRYTIDSI